MGGGDGTPSPWLLVTTAMAAVNSLSDISTGGAGGSGDGGGVELVAMASADAGVLLLLLRRRRKTCEREDFFA